MNDTMTERRPDKAEPKRTNPELVPDVDIRETDDIILVMADLPGVAPDQVSVTLEDDHLTLEGVATVPGLDKHQLVHAEFGTGDFRRAFTLSAEIDRDHIVARIKDGVLRLTLPKVHEARVRKIAVAAA